MRKFLMIQSRLTQSDSEEDRSKMLTKSCPSFKSKVAFRTKVLGANIRQKGSISGFQGMLYHKVP